MSASLSSPRTATATRTAPAGGGVPGGGRVARGTRATALGTGARRSSSTGTTTPSPASCSRRSVCRSLLAPASGARRRRSESTVAMSLKGMPTAVLHPRSR